MQTNGAATLEQPWTFTPELAADIMSRTPPHEQRRQRKAAIAQYATDIAEGRWVVNGETIVLSDTGSVLDGQHRLLACIAAGRPFQSYVVTGRPRSVFPSLNIGKTRTPADALGIDGESNQELLSSTLRMIWHHERGAISNIASGKDPWLPEAAREVLSRHPDVRASVARFTSKHEKRLIPNASAAFVHYMGGSVWGFDKADAFWDAVESGENLHASHPALLLRNRLVSESLAVAGKGFLESKGSRRYRLALTILAWNAYVTGKPLQRLVVQKNRSPEFAQP